MSSTALPARPSRRRAPPSPAKDELQSPVTSHPLGQGEPPAAAPRSTAKSRPDKAKQADGRKSGGGAGRGAALAVLVVLLAVAGGGLYSRYGGPGGELLLAQLGSPRELLAQMKSPRELLARLGLSAWAPASGPPRKQQPRDPRDSLLPGGVELIPQPVPQLPPLPPITQQEIEAFEQARLGGRVWMDAWCCKACACRLAMGLAMLAGSAADCMPALGRQRLRRWVVNTPLSMLLASAGHRRALWRARVTPCPGGGTPPGAGAAAGAGGGGQAGGG